MTASGSQDEFFNDLLPFFHGKSLTYVDVGAYVGKVFRKVLGSGLKIREAHLVEPNPAALQRLREVAVDVGGQSCALSIYPVALGAEVGTARLQAGHSMTRVVETTSWVSQDNIFEVECRTLDDLAGAFTERRVSLLKIDAEGSELRILSGATQLLAEERVDVIYVEAGMNPEGTQQCYYRDIDASLRARGYRLFRVYEQMHEWLEDSPVLRRVNLAYFSHRFAIEHPFRLTQELFAAQKRVRAAEAEVSAVRGQAVAVRSEGGELDQSRLLLEEVRTLKEANLDLELGARAARRERDELATRLSLVVEDHQRGLLALAHEASKAAAQAREREQLAARYLESEMQRQRLAREVADLERERDRMASELKASVAAFDALRGQYEDADRTWKETLEKQREGAAAHEIERLAALRTSLEVTTTERDALRDQAQTWRTKHAETEQMSREVHKLYENLRNRERRARSEAAAAMEKVRRTRQHLSYRLGAALIESSRSPKGWLTAPVVLRRAYRDFVRDRPIRPGPGRTTSSESIRQGSPAIGLPMLGDWQEFIVLADGGGELWAQALSVTGGSVAIVEMQLEAEDEAARLVDLAGEASSAVPSGELQRVLKLRAGRSSLLVRYDARGTLNVRLRKTRGEPCILRLELRPTRGGALASSSSGEERFRRPTSLLSRAAGARGMLARTGSVSNVLFESFKLVRDGRGQEGLQLALAHASDAERAGVSLIRALLVESDEKAWLSHVNDYLRPMGIAPLELSKAGPSRFHRLCARTLGQRHDGPLVTVIMPAYNAEATLEHAAASIMSQTWGRIQLIIVDDASSDATWSIASSIAARDPRVTVLRNAGNVGPYVSKNIALRLAKGDYVTGHDADDWAHPERIERHLSAMQAGGVRMRASLAGMLRMTAAGELTRFAPKGPNTVDGALVAGFISCLFDSHFLKQVLGGWDEVRFAGDSEIIQRTERILGAPIPRFPHLGMICLDSPEGLTNHPELGYSPLLGMSPPRREYRDSFKRWHERITAADAHLPFPQAKRTFSVPASLAVDGAALALTLDDHTRAGVLRSADACDVCIVTDLRLPGGNASSTLDEVRFLRGRGVRVLLIHCPSVRTQGKPISERYADCAEICVPFHDVRQVKAAAVIVRHPAVVASPNFRTLAPRISARAAAIIVNNSIARSDGSSVYSMDDMLENAAALDCPRARVFPLGPVIRRELVAMGGSAAGSLAAHDWTPTFDPGRLTFKPKPVLAPPFVIGRHARDGAEKWLERRERLLHAYPGGAEFSVCILGGADAALAVLGDKPRNWEVLPFGSMDPAEYLAKLDVFVYFPHSGLNEAFGRAVMEAVFSGVPCVLPKSLRTTFDDMAFYSEPEDVAGVVRRLSLHPEWRLDFLRHARERARRYESMVLAERMAELGAALPGERTAEERNGPSLASAVREYKAWVETGRWSMGAALAEEH